MIKTPIVLKGAAALADISGPATAYVADVEFDVVHHVPGRLRLRSPVLKGNACGIERRRRQLADIAGIVSVNAKPATGSFLLTYDPAALPPGRITEMLAAGGIKLRTADESPAAHTREGEELVAALKRLALELLAELAIVGLTA